MHEQTTLRSLPGGPSMLRLAALALGFLGYVAVARPAASEVDDAQPTVRGKTAAQWLSMLQTDPKPERRQASVIAIGILGAKVEGTVPGLAGALKDTDASVRRSAAQALGEMG